MSSATKNARPESAARRGSRGRGRGRGRGAVVREIRFTMMYDQIFKEIVLNENNTVESLKKMVEFQLNIPINKQLIYGWPGIEPTDDSVKFKDFLNLDKPDADFLLYVAVTGALESDASLDRDGARPGTSRQLNSVETSSSSSQRQTETSSSSTSDIYQLHVTDCKNNESYNEMFFEGHQSVRQIKEIFAELSNIPTEFQEWYGWPDAADSENTLLRNAKLEKPFHSLVLIDQRESETTDALVLEAPGLDATVPDAGNTSANETDTSTIVLTTEPQDKEKEPVVKPKKVTARKSTSKAALQNARQKLNDSKMKPGNTVRFQDDQEQPGTSRSMINSNNDSFSSAMSETSLLSISDDAGPTTPKRIRIDETLSQCSSTSKSPRKNESPKQSGPWTTLHEKYVKYINEVKYRNDAKYKQYIDNRKDLVNEILQYLDPLSHLSLRRVCKTTKMWVETMREYTRQDEEKWTNLSLTVTGFGYKTFETAVNMNLPITHFVFDIFDETFYDRSDVDIFMQDSSLRVKNLKLKKFFMFQNSGERKMFETFRLIEKLTIEDLVIPETVNPLPCPRTLATLQVLKLKYEIIVPQDNSLVRPKCWDLTWSMLNDCVSLLYFQFPRTKERRDETINTNLFSPLLDYISMRQRIGGVSLEYLDLKYFNNPESFYINRFVDLLRRCYKKDIKLKNVQSLIIQQVFDEDGAVNDDKFKFSNNIVSLINYSAFLENAHLHNLEQIKVDVIPSVTDYESFGKNFKNIFWPRLRSIKIIDSVGQEKTGELWSNWQQVQEDLYGHHGIYDRGRVEYIKIDSPKLPYFLSEGRLSEKFYNLKRLEIVSWCRTDSVLDKRLSAIWNKLRLEELRIENCPKLNDSSFIGEEDDDEYEELSPPFLTLRETLKKLTLGLDETKVTDQSLIRVFSKMKFKIFILKSTKPTKISEVGLLKLSKGEFGKQIEHFPFDCWSSASIDAGRFKRLAKKFRSLR